MVGKFVTFVLFVSLGQCYSSSSPNLSYGLSEKEAAILTQIRISEEVTILGKIEGYGKIFYLIKKYASALIYNLENECDDQSAIIDTALAEVQNTLEYFLESIQIGLNKSDSVVGESKDTVSGNLNASFAAISSALTLAASGNLSASQAQLEVYRDTVRDCRRGSIGAVFDFIHALLNTTNTDVIAIVELAYAETRRGIEQLTYAIFNGITVYAAAAATGQGNEFLIPDIEDYQQNGLDGIDTDVAYTFIPLRTLYIYDKLKLSPSNLYALYANQVALDVSFRNFKKEGDAIFGTITSYVRRVYLRLHDSGEVAVTQADVAQALALSKLTAGYTAVLDAVLVAHPDAFEAVAAVRGAFSISSPHLIANIFNAIDAARASVANYSESIRRIEEYKISVHSYIDVYVGSYYFLFRSNATLDSDTEAQFVAIRELAVELLVVFVDNIFAAIKSLANVLHTGEATLDDFANIQGYQAIAYSALNNYTQCASAASLLVIRAGN